MIVSSTTLYKLLYASTTPAQEREAALKQYGKYLSVKPTLGSGIEEVEEKETFKEDDEGSKGTDNENVGKLVPAKLSKERTTDTRPYTLMFKDPFDGMVEIARHLTREQADEIKALANKEVK